MFVRKSTMKRRLETQAEIHRIEMEQASRLGIIRYVLANNVTLFNQNIGVAASKQIAVDPYSDDSIRAALAEVEA